MQLKKRARKCAVKIAPLPPCRLTVYCCYETCYLCHLLVTQETNFSFYISDFLARMTCNVKAVIVLQ